MRCVQKSLSIAFIAALLLPAALFAQGTARQSGKIMDKDGNPIEGAKVTAVHLYSKQQHETFTDEEGRFLFPRLSDGMTAFVITKDGFKPYQTRKNLIGGRRNRPLNIKLEIDPDAGKPKLTNEEFAKAAKMVQEQKYAEAKEIFLLFVEGYPELAAAWFNLGISCLGTNENSDAAEAFEKVLELEPDNLNAMLLAANAYTQLKKIPKAIEHYEKYLEAKPDDVETWYGLGQLHNYQQERELAIECFDKVLELNPDNTDALMMKGFTLVDVKREDEAIPLLSRFLELQPEGANAKRVTDALAKIHLAKGKKLMEEVKYEEAVEHLNKYLELKPDADDADEVRAMIAAAEKELQQN